MNFPLYNLGVFNLDVGLVLAVVLGMGFGFALERGGFGSARKLAAQFYLYDMTVLKVMFTAIITAMVGVFTLWKLGYVNLDLMWINPTFLWPQIVGGLLLGAGFIISGYCPGTSIVASVSGKLDGMLTVAGVIFGIITFGLFYTPELAAFHTSGAMGRLMLSDLLGVDPLMLTAAVVAVAGMAFLFAEWMERTFKSPEGQLVGSLSVARVGMVVVASLLAVAGIFAFQDTAVPTVQAADRSEMETVSPLDVGQWIVEGRKDVLLVDLRQNPDPAMPAALPLNVETLRSADGWYSTLPAHKLIVLISNDAEVLETLTPPAEYRLAVLKGGYDNWKQTVLTEPASVVTEEDQIRQSLYNWFTGSESEAPKVTAPPVISTGGGKKKKIAGGC